MEFLEILANQMATAIDNAILLQKLERANLELTRAYDATLEAGPELWNCATGKPKGTAGGLPK